LTVCLPIREQRGVTEYTILGENLGFTFLTMNEAEWGCNRGGARLHGAKDVLQASVVGVEHRLKVPTNRVRTDPKTAIRETSHLVVLDPLPSKRV
jgi:hypothetical protein